MAHQSNSLLSAFKQALKDYKPWHAPKWSSTRSQEQDPFPHIIEIAERLGFLCPDSACQAFNIHADEYNRWRQGSIPERRVRKKVWTYLRRAVGIK